MSNHTKKSRPCPPLTEAFLKRVCDPRTVEDIKDLTRSLLPPVYCLRSFYYFYPYMKELRDFEIQATAAFEADDDTALQTAYKQLTSSCYATGATCWARYIQALKEMPYKEYLQTSHWQLIRQKALKRARNRCQLCNNKGQLDVHHRTYEHRGEERLHEVTVLCRNCHAKFHDKLTTPSN